MTITDVRKDLDTFTMTITAEFDATVERAWQLWADPRQLERWWGPPEYPATFVDHELVEGAAVTYFMTSPEGEQYHGWWRVIAVDPPHSLEVEDGFGDTPADAAPDLPVTTMGVALVPGDAGGTRMTITSRFGSLEAMEQILAMGAEEGMLSAMGQIEGVLAS